MRAWVVGGKEGGGFFFHYRHTSRGIVLLLPFVFYISTC